MKSALMNLWDKLGIGLSALCLIHCLALPLFFLLYPSVAHFHNELEWFHPAIFVLISSTTIIAFWPKQLHHRHYTPFLIALVGLIIIFIGTFLAHDINFDEHLITSIGSLSMVMAHILNLKNKKLGLPHHCSHC